MHKILQEFSTSQWVAINEDGSRGDYHSDSDYFEPESYFMCDDCDFTTEIESEALTHMEKTANEVQRI